MTRKGFIGLQVHGIGGQNPDPPMTVQWRNINIKDMGVQWETAPEGADVLLGGEADLANWVNTDTGGPIGWKWQDGAMVIEPGTGSIDSKAKYQDCHLHLEFNTRDNGGEGQDNGNSGVYLMGRYEVQILNSYPRGPAHNEAGGIYSIKAPDYAMARPAGEWQSYDIIFTAPKWDGDKKVTHAKMTVYHNGTRIHKDVEIPRNTVAADEGESPGAGPIYLQDHSNIIRFRNIWVNPL
jgi:hypothetical protein